MTKKILIGAAIVLGVVSLLVNAVVWLKLAQNPTLLGQLLNPPVEPVSGTIEQVDGDTLTVKTATDTKTVRFEDDAIIVFVSALVPSEIPYAPPVDRADLAPGQAIQVRSVAGAEGEPTQLIEVISPALMQGVVTEKTDGSVTLDLPEAFPARSFTYSPDVPVSLGGFGTTELKTGSLSDLAPGKIVFLFLAAPYQGKTESITKLIVVQPPTAASAAGEETNDLEASTQ